MNGAVELPLDQPELGFTATGECAVRRTVLPSGVRILTEQVPGARSVTLGFWVAVGSRDELPGHYGSTHFLEHLLFKGTSRRSALDIAVSFDSVGGEHNALTSREYTCYYAKIRDRDLPMAVEVLCDMMTSSLLDPAEFETERGVILEELAMAEDDPADRVGEAFFEAVFGAHPLGRPIGGNSSTITAVSRAAVYEHYRENYRPQDLVITAAGAAPHDELVRRVSESLSVAGWDEFGLAAPVARRSAVAATIERGSALTIVHRPIEQANILLGIPGLTSTDPRRTALAVLNAVLGGGMASRLFQEIREKRGLAYSVYSFAPSFSDTGLFGSYAGCSPTKAPDVAQLMLAEFHRLADSGISAHELERAKGQLSGASALSLEDSDTRMSRLGRAEISLGEFHDFDESLRRLELVSNDDVVALAEDLVSRPLSIAVVGTAEESAMAAATGVLNSS